jgi:hypothetical protein
VYKLLFGEKYDHIGIVIDTDEIGLGISFGKRSKGWVLDITIIIFYIYITG